MSATSPSIQPIFARKDPALWPRMLLPRRAVGLDRWPFTDPSIRYHYLGRNASYHLVKQLGLAGHELLFPGYFGGPVLEAPRAGGARISFYPVRAGLRVEPDDILAAIGPETRAIYLIHFAGFPGPIEEVASICAERGLLLIEDCAHSILTSVAGRQTGTFGDGAIFSLYKWVPVPNGAALTIKHGSAMVEPLKRASRASGVALTTFSLLDGLALRGGAPGRATRSAVRSAGRVARRATGSNYVSTGGVDFSREHLDLEMSPFAHRILAAQDWSEIARRRRRNFLLLADELGELAPPEQGSLSDGTVPLFYATRVEHKVAVHDRLRAKGVEARNFWAYFHPTLPEGVFPETDDLRRSILELPIHQDLAANDIVRMAKLVRETIGVRPRLTPGTPAFRPTCACELANEPTAVSHDEE